MITLQHLRKVYGKGEQTVIALDDVSLEIPRGNIFGVLGQSGAGKSTLIRCINLLEQPTAGTVIVNNQEITSLRGSELRKARQHIGMIFQHFNLLNSRTVADNIAFPLEVIGQSRSARKRRVVELLSLVGLEDKAKAYPAQLSGGQKQRVGIARALAVSPDILLSDEATSALDPETTRSILDLLYDLNQRIGLTILLITHEMGVVKQICDRVAIMESGKIVEQGQVSELAIQPGTRLAQALFPQPSLVPSAQNGQIVSIAFLGQETDQPVLSNMIRQFDVNVNILSGSIETLRQQRIGQLQIEVVGQQIDAALTYLREHGLNVEVHS
jgi:ABC-type metal ion transport system, ATPase component